MSKFTPGKWEVRERGNTFHTLAVYSPTTKVCTLAASNSAANARLIAAAPEMAEMLKRAAKVIWDYEGAPGLWREIATLLARIEGDA